MELIVNPIFCDEIFGAFKTRKFFAAMLVSLGTPRWPLRTMSNTRSPITLGRNALALPNLAQMYSFKLSTIPLTFWNRNLIF